MPRNYYLFNPGRLSRKENTIYFRRYNEIDRDQVIADFEEQLEHEPEFLELDPALKCEESGDKRVIPVEDIDDIYVFGEADFNRKFFNFCGTNQIMLHIFNYYGYYSGTFYPREFLNSGALLVKQVMHQQDEAKRLTLARKFVEAASNNILKNLQYYNTRGKDCSPFIDQIQKLQKQFDNTGRVDELMGIEGNIRNVYFEAFPLIIDPEIHFKKRVRRPPNNMINALISFGNSMVYTAVLAEIYRTQLNPLISYLHEPGTKRFSLSLDLAEIFKPLLADRIIFTLLNKKQLTEKHFTKKGRVCWLSDEGRKIYLKILEERMQTTVKHRKLNKKVSYRRLIRLECYKLIKHVLGQHVYKPFVIWW